MVPVCQRKKIREATVSVETHKKNDEKREEEEMKQKTNFLKEMIMQHTSWEKIFSKGADRIKWKFMQRDKKKEKTEPIK